MRKVEINGKLVDAEVMDFETIKHEQWSTYKLTDGTIVKSKLVMQEIVKLHGEYAANGEPIYQVTAGTASTSEALPTNLASAQGLQNKQGIKLQ